MAEKELEIKVRWENNNFFEMGAKEPGSEWITVVKIDENSTIKGIWGEVDRICHNYFTYHLNEIGKEMKA